MWATIETAVNVAVRKAEARFRLERQQYEEKVGPVCARGCVCARALNACGLTPGPVVAATGRLRAGQIQALEDDVQTLRRDGEAKAQIIHEYLMRERSGQMGMLAQRARLMRTADGHWAMI